MQSRDDSTATIYISAERRIDLNQLDKRFNADNNWGEMDPLLKTLHVAQSDEAELIEILKKHPDIISIKSKTLQHEIVPIPELEKMSLSDPATLFSHPKARINISASMYFDLSEIDPRLPAKPTMTEVFPKTAFFFVDQKDEAELIEKLKQDDRIYSVNKEDTAAGLAYQADFSTKNTFSHS